MRYVNLTKRSVVMRPILIIFPFQHCYIEVIRALTNECGTGNVIPNSKDKIPYFNSERIKLGPDQGWWQATRNVGFFKMANLQEAIGRETKMNNRTPTRESTGARPSRRPPTDGRPPRRAEGDHNTTIDAKFKMSAQIDKHPRLL